MNTSPVLLRSRDRSRDICNLTVAMGAPRYSEDRNRPFSPLLFFSIPASSRYRGDIRPDGNKRRLGCTWPNPANTVHRHVVDGLFRQSIYDPHDPVLTGTAHVIDPTVTGNA